MDLSLLIYDIDQVFYYGDYGCRALSEVLVATNISEPGKTKMLGIFTNRSNNSITQVRARTQAPGMDLSGCPVSTIDIFFLNYLLVGT
eukprot:SAG31_NODE_7725_length_1608_cov_1.662691_1_plen_88_part_00